MVNKNLTAVAKDWSKGHSIPVGFIPETIIPIYDKPIIDRIDSAEATRDAIVYRIGKQGNLINHEYKHDYCNSVSANCSFGTLECLLGNINYAKLINESLSKVISFSPEGLICTNPTNSIDLSSNSIYGIFEFLVGNTIKAKEHLGLIKLNFSSTDGLRWESIKNSSLNLYSNSLLGILEYLVGSEPESSIIKDSLFRKIAKPNPALSSMLLGESQNDSILSTHSNAAFGILNYLLDNREYTDAIITDIVSLFPMEHGLLGHGIENYRLFTNSNSVFATLLVAERLVHKSLNKKY